MFTEQSQHNQGGLRQITQSPLEVQRLGAFLDGRHNLERQALITRGMQVGDRTLGPDPN